jgi:aminopeptidase N
VISNLTITMKKNLLLLIVALAVFPVLLAQKSIQIRGSEYCSKQKIQKGALSDFRFARSNSQGHSYDVLNYTMELDLMDNYSDPYPASFSANEVIKFRIDTALNAIVLNAVNSSLTIDSVKMDAISFTHQDDLLKVYLDRTYNAGEIAEIKIYYRHNDTNDGAVYASSGFFFTDCEPEGARKWFPCYDSPSDKATVDITASVPLGVLLGSNGRLQDSIPDSNSITYHWISRDPVATYLVVITSKVNYQLDIVQWLDTITNQVVPIRFYYNDGENPAFIESIIGDMTSYYSAEYGDHPFEKNGFSTLNDQFFWGGMENQSLTSLAPNYWFESIIAHEFAHQWFGDMVTCATWADIFLNEGFATWSEAHWIEFVSGYNSYKDELAWNASAYISDNPGWPISDPLWATSTPDINTLFNLAVTYNKGSCVLHQLRYVLGDSLFFAGLKGYATDTNFRYKSATISDFRDKMEVVSGQDLNWFFDEWIYKPNHPLYRNVYAIKHLDSGKWQVKFTARQLSSALDPYWQMPLEIKIRFMDLSDTLVKVFNSYNDQIFIFEFDVQPVNLSFDPNNQILLKQGSTIVGEAESLPASGMSMSVTPDPFTTSSLVKYQLAQPSVVSIQILDQVGRKITSNELGKQTKGDHTYFLDGNHLKPGVYFFRVVTGEMTETIKVIHN